MRRFAVSETREIEEFNRFSDWIFNYPHTDADEQDWLRRQGPVAPGLLEHLQRTHRSYDILIFFTCLYAPTALGLQIDPSRSILVPTAHDEPAIKLRIYRDLFRKAKAIAYNTDVERRFLNSIFDIRATAEATVGCGVDLPQNRPHPGTPEAAEAAANDDENSPDKGYGNRRRMRGRGEAFRRRHRLHGPVALYGGRIDPGKGCEELLQYFNGYQRTGGDATLVLMGAKLMPLPEDPSVRFAGMLSEAERAEALEAATVVVVPSPHESLSLLALEAMAVGTPLLVNGRSDVLVDHCRKSQAGLYYVVRGRVHRSAEDAARRRSPARPDGPQRPAVRQDQLPLGRHHAEVRRPDGSAQALTCPRTFRDAATDDLATAMRVGNAHAVVAPCWPRRWRGPARPASSTCARGRGAAVPPVAAVLDLPGAGAAAGHPVRRRRLGAPDLHAGRDAGDGGGHPGG